MKFFHMGVYVFLHLLIGSFIWQVSFLILMTFILSPMGKLWMLSPWHFWDFGNKYKKSVGRLTFCYIRTFKIIKKVKAKGISHLGTNLWPTRSEAVLHFSLRISLYDFCLDFSFSVILGISNLPLKRLIHESRVLKTSTSNKYI